MGAGRNASVTTMTPGSRLLSSPKLRLPRARIRADPVVALPCWDVVPRTVRWWKRQRPYQYSTPADRAVSTDDGMTEPSAWCGRVSRHRSDVSHTRPRLVSGSGVFEPR